MRAALVTPCISHLPFHPSCFLGYGAAVIAARYDLDVIDLNAEMHFKNRAKLKSVLDGMDMTPSVSDAVHLHPFYDAVETSIDSHYAAIPWENYQWVYVTPPSWFPTVSAEEVLRLSRAINRVSPDTGIFFLGNSLDSWTNAGKLKANGVRTVHLNAPFTVDQDAKPVRYDGLPPPVYAHRDKYLFDLLPFTLKHGCPWGRCRFCSLSKGWNSGYLERSAKSAIKELEALVERYDPKVLVCRDHSLNGHNLIEICSYLAKVKKPWGGQTRADLSEKQIEALAAAGCRELYFGLESGSDQILGAMHKGITSNQMSAFIKRLHANGILAAPSLIIGAPGEGRADFEKTIQFLQDHRRCLDVVNVYPFMATPASEFSSRKKQAHKNTLMRLFRCIQVCKDLGLKVIVGEQSIEYFLFKGICRDRRPGY